MISKNNTIDKYINSLSIDKRIVINELDSKIRRLFSSQPKLWSQKLWGGTDQNIIGYGEYTHKYSSGKVVTWFLVGLTVQKNYFSVYINAVENGKYLPETVKEALGKVKVGKSSITFKKIEDLNVDCLIELIKKAILLNSINT